MQTNTASEYLTIGDVSRDLGVSTTAVRQYIERGRLPVNATTASGMKLVRRDVYDAFKRERAARQR